MAAPTRYTRETMAAFFRNGDWEFRTWSSVWDRNARDYPHKEAIVGSGKRLTWAEAKVKIDRIALSLLEFGFQKDEVLVGQLPNSMDLCLLRVACEKAGVLCLPALRTLRHQEMAYLLKYTEAAGIVIPWEFRNFNYLNMVEEIKEGLPLRHVFIAGNRVPEGALSIEAMMERPLEEKYPPDYLDRTRFQPDEVSWVSLTTGTTGQPKFVENVLASYATAGRLIAQRLGITSTDVVALLHAAPAGPNNAGYYAAPEAVAKIVMMERYDTEEAFRLIEREKVTAVCVVPAQLAMMISHPLLGKYDLTSVRFWRSGGAPLPYQLGLEADRALPGVIVNGFGSSDSGATFLNSPFAPQEIRLGTVGKPIAGHKLKIVDDDGREVAKGEVGEVWLGGSLMTSGYFKDPETTAQCWTEEGWFKTGDLGKLDDDDNLVIAGRKKDMIIRGGQNIYAMEVENMLLTHPHVADCAIVGMPDPVMGERACTFVVCRPGRVFTFEDMVGHLKSKNIVAYKLPERLEIVESLPVVGDQKVDRKLLKEQIARKLATEGSGEKS